eukprot:10703015-Heterocapsa_arctica.AAC.1
MYMCTSEGGPFPGHPELELGLREWGRGEGGLAGSPEPARGVSIHGLLAQKSDAVTTELQAHFQIGV